MMIRLAELEVGSCFTVDNTTYIKLEHSSGLDNDSGDLAINKDPLATVDLAKRNELMTLSERALASLISVSQNSCCNKRKAIDVRVFAKYKNYILQHVHDCWFLHWTNKAQGHNGDYCYVDANGNYCVVNETDDNNVINGDGNLNIRTLCWFDPNTIVSTMDT